MAEPFKSLALEAGLRKLLNGQRHFSICEFDTLVQLANVTVPAQMYLELRALHCVDYAAMRPELHRQVVERMHDIFGFALPAFEAKVVEPEPTRQPFYRRLFGAARTQETP